MQQRWHLPYNFPCLSQGHILLSLFSHNRRIQLLTLFLSFINFLTYHEKRLPESAEEVKQCKVLGVLSVEISINASSCWNAKAMIVRFLVENVSNSPIRIDYYLREKFKQRPFSVKKDHCWCSLLLMFSFSFHENELRILNDLFSQQLTSHPSLKHHFYGSILLDAVKPFNFCLQLIDCKYSALKKNCYISKHFDTLFSTILTIS